MKTAVLLMAYGSPRTLDEVEAYFTDIRGGRTPSPDALEELTDRYRAIGGPSSLNEITAKQADAVAAALDAKEPGRFRVFVGMKHWHPFIQEAVAEIAAEGIESIIGLVLAPHYSKKSIGEYTSRVEAAIESLDIPLDLNMTQSWFDNDKMIEFVADGLKSVLDGWDPSDGKTRVFFTAHSIPQRIIDEGDPYKDQLAASADLYAAAAGITDYEISWQSASHTGELWIGPDILETLDAFAASGGRRAIVAPVGFVSDHLEVAYDVDVECMEKAREIGIELRRLRSPNDHPDFIAAVTDVIGEAS